MSNYSYQASSIPYPDYSGEARSSPFSGAGSTKAYSGEFSPITHSSRPSSNDLRGNNYYSDYQPQPPPLPSHSSPSVSAGVESPLPNHGDALAYNNLPEIYEVIVAILFLSLSLSLHL
jgi:hypothetical protein